MLRGLLKEVLGPTKNMVNRKRNGNGGGVRRVPRRTRQGGVRRRRRVLRPRVDRRTVPAAVNIASTMRSTQARNVQCFSNTDRLVHTVLPAGTPRGTVIYDQIITPAIAARLRTQSSLFQKIEYASLRFEVQTQTPTTNAGGYVIAFLHDPQMEVGSGETALRALTAIQGTQTSKFWQSSVMSVQTTKQQYFTLQGNDVRLFSPGRFIVLSDGEPTESVAVTILFHWTVRLTRPALQRLVARLPQVVVVSSMIGSTASNTVRDNNYIIYGNSQGGPFTPAGTDGGPTDPRVNVENAFAGLPPPASVGSNILFYQLPQPVTFTVHDGPGTSTVSAQFIGFSVVQEGTGYHYRAEYYRMPFSNAAAPTLWKLGTRTEGETGTSVEGFVDFVQGTRLTPVLPDEFFGTTSGAFFVSVSQSVSVNQQPMISKELQQISARQSIPKLPLKETLQERLSALQLTDW